MKNLVLIVSLLVLASCGKNGKDGSSGLDGKATFGINGVSTGVDFDDIAPGLACANGGVSIYSFRDENSDGLYQSGDESLIKVKALCNGLDGTNGADGQDGADGANGTNSSTTLESFVSSVSCPNGGVKISSNTSAPVEICNGVNGLNGEQGIPGIQGLPGMAGADGVNGTNGSNGTVITPVKFCQNDNSTFPEYGLMIGSELFAVYWGTTPASPSTPQAFLTKLVAGNYMSTGGNNCLFSVP